MRSVMIFLMLCVSVFANNEIGAGNQPIHFLLPVNSTTTPNYNLDVTIPKGFISLQPFKQWEKAKLIEFVPQGQNGDNWSEIISINKFIGEHIAADILLQKVKQLLLADSDSGHVLDESVEHTADYTKAMFLISYHFHGQHEIIEALYYSGPFDCSGVQYTVRIDQDHPEAAALQKIKEFISTINLDH